MDVDNEKGYCAWKNNENQRCVPVDEDHSNPDEALAAAIKMRKFLLERMIEDRQHFPENDDNDENDNLYEPYELKVKKPLRNPNGTPRQGT